MAAHLDLGIFAQPLEVLRFRASMERLQWERPDRVRNFQMDLLRRTLDHAARSVPYYRPLGLRAGRDADPAGRLASLPLLSRTDVRTRRETLIAEDRARYRPKEIMTSGSSGEPARLLLDRRSFAMEFAHYWRHWSWAGYRLGDPFVEFSTAHFLERRETFILQRAARRLLLNAVRLDAGSAAAHAARIRQHGARFIKSAPSTLAAFCSLCDASGARVNGIKAVFCQGETFRPDQRRRIETFFGCKAYDSYGQMERVAAIAECPSGRMHVLEDYGFVERVPEPGTASVRIIGTSFHNRSMPLLRYDTGDLAADGAEQGPCPCGRSFPTVARIEGRSEDALTPPDGRIVPAAYLALDGIEGLENFRIIQDGPDRARVLALVRQGPLERGAGDPRKAVLERMERVAGPGMRFSFEAIADPGLWLNACGEGQNPSGHGLGPAGAGRIKFRTVINRTLERAA
jgi:phenylacetate-CoA ligase